MLQENKKTELYTRHNSVLNLNKKIIFYPLIALIPGSAFPSIYSSIAPPPVET